MKRIVAVAILLMFTLAGCGGDGGDAAPVKSTASVEVLPTAERGTPERTTYDTAAFLLLSSKTPYGSSPADAQVGLARKICKSFDDGVSIDDITDAMVRSGEGRVSIFQAAYFVGVATAAFCPEHKPSNSSGGQ